MLMHPAAVADVAFLRCDDFFLRQHGVIYEAIVSTLGTHGVSDPIAVTEELRRRGQLDEAGGHNLLLDLLDGCITPVGVVHHAEIVQERARTRHAVSAAG